MRCPTRKQIGNSIGSDRTCQRSTCTPGGATTQLLPVHALLQTQWREGEACGY